MLIDIIVEMRLGKARDEGVLDETVVEDMLVKTFAEHVLVEVVVAGVVVKEVRREVAVGADGALQIMVVGIVLKEADRKIYDICDNKLAAKIDLLEVNCEVEDVVVAIDREVEVIGLEHVLDDGLVDVLQEVAREACAHETGLNKESVDEDGLVQKVLDEAVNVILEKVREQGLRMLRLHSSEEDAKCCYCTSVVGRGTKSVCSVFTLPYNQMRNVSTSAVHSRTGVVRRRTRTHTSILPKEKCEYVISASPPTTASFLAAHRKFMYLCPIQLCDCVA